MTARYWVLVSDELVLAIDPSLLPDGLRLSGHPAGSGTCIVTPPPGTHWHQFEDDNAPDELDGKRVELVLGRRGRTPAKAVIIERRVIA